MSGEGGSPDCPLCGHPMEVFDGRERTVGDGRWVTLWCPRCCHVEDVWVPGEVQSGGHVPVTPR